MGLISLTKDGVSFLKDETSIIRVYSVGGVTKVEVISDDLKSTETLIVSESLATIDGLSDDLISLTFDGVTFLLNSEHITNVVDYNGGSKISYTSLNREIAVDETPAQVNALFPIIGDGNGIYDGNGTAPAATTVTLTDYIAFNGGEFRTENGYYQGATKILYINPNGTTFNTFVGGAAGNATMTGISNVGLGYAALSSLTTGANNIGIGDSALNSNATGGNNVAVGYQSLSNSTVGNLVAIGYQSLKANTSGTSNTAVGYQALLNNTTGYENTAIGNASMGGNTTAWRNVALGHNTLNANTTGNSNVAIGYNALAYNPIANSNVAIGNDAIGYTSSNVTGNVGIGLSALKYVTTDNLVAVGKAALAVNTSGDFNTAIGSSCMPVNTTGSYNTAIGLNSLYSNIVGNYNVSIGVQTLFSSTSSSNTAVGDGACYSQVGGASSTALGRNSLYSNVSGTQNIALGYYSGYYETASNSLYIHNGLGVSNLATGKSNSIIYGVMDAVVANQRLNLNANVGIGGGVANGTSVLNIANLPVSSVGLVTGDVWSNAGVLTIV